MKISIFSWFLIAGILSGCVGSTVAQQQFETMNNNFTQSQLRYIECATKFAQSHPAPDSLLQHFPLDIKQPSVEQMMDEAFASDDEIKFLREGSPDAIACRSQFYNDIARVNPSLALIVLSAANAKDEILLKVVKREMPWGEYIKQTRDISIHYEQQMREEADRIKLALNQSHQAELAQRQAAARAFGQAMQQWGQNQQMIYQMNRPVMTNCHASGNYVNCTTY